MEGQGRKPQSLFCVYLLRSESAGEHSVLGVGIEPTAEMCRQAIARETQRNWDAATLEFIYPVETPGRYESPVEYPTWYRKLGAPARGAPEGFIGDYDTKMHLPGDPLVVGPYPPPPSVCEREGHRFGYWNSTDRARTFCEKCGALVVFDDDAAPRITLPKVEQGEPAETFGYFISDGNREFCNRRDMADIAEGKLLLHHKGAAALARFWLDHTVPAVKP